MASRGESFCVPSARENYSTNTGQCMVSVRTSTKDPKNLLFSCPPAKVSVTGQHLENYQELLTGRLLLSEFALSFQLLQHGGTFVCSVFDVFTPFTVREELEKEIIVCPPCHVSGGSFCRAAKVLRLRTLERGYLAVLP